MLHSFEHITFQEKDRMAIITLNRADKRNALDDLMVRELLEAFTLAEEDDNTKVIVLAANGTAFCAGADLAYLQKLQTFSAEENLQDSQQLMSLFWKIHDASKVVIAQIQGHAIAGGCGLASACDILFAVPEAKFGYTEVRIGFIPAIVAPLLVSRIGQGRAKEMLLSGNLYTAHEMLDKGFLNFVVPAEELPTTVETYCQRLCTENAALSMQVTKKLLHDLLELPHKAIQDHTSRLNATSRKTDECQQGIQAFLEKRKPNWS